MTKTKKRNKYPKLIWQNYEVDLKDYEDFLEEEYPEVTDDYEKFGLCRELNDEYFEDERANLNMELEEDIIIIADIGLWFGRRTGYRELHDSNLSSVLNFESDCGYAEWYVDRYLNIRSRQSHHDGTHSLIYRMWKPGLSDEQKECFLDKMYYGKATSKDLTRYTKRLGDYVRKVYGW